MKKHAYIDMGTASGLKPSQTEKILCALMNISKEDFFKLTDISGAYIYDFQQALYQFEAGTPEEYLLGMSEFYGRQFYVNENVLIPRVETEILVSEALNILNSNRDIKNTVYIDVGTGSSCIATSIILELLPLKFDSAYGLDISSEALEVAKKNTNQYGVAIDLKESDLLETLFHEERLKNKHLCITANLPYIKNGDFENMGVSTVKYEPDMALYGGAETGFELYETLVKQVFQMKQIHKLGIVDMFIEIGFNQAGVSQKFLTEMGLKFEYFEDSASIQRVIHIYGF